VLSLSLSLPSEGTSTKEDSEVMVMDPLREKKVGSGFGAGVLKLQQFSMFLFVCEHSLLALPWQRHFAAVALKLGQSESDCRKVTGRRQTCMSVTANTADLVLFVNIGSK
jgi:hypothetical protein